MRIDRVAACKAYRDHTPPVLENLMVDFGPWDRTANTAGAFKFVAGKERIFFEFGYVINFTASASGASQAGSKVNGTFTYDLSPEVNILAPVTGIITEVVYKSDSDDYELAILTSPHSDWSVRPDHIKGITVKVGDKVTAGQVIGKASTGKPGYSVMPEVQINEEIADENSTFEHRVRSKNRVHCPATFVSADLRAKVERLMKDWEAFKGKAVYPQNMVLPGCTKLYEDIYG